MQGVEPAMDGPTTAETACVPSLPYVITVSSAAPDSPNSPLSQRHPANIPPPLPLAHEYLDLIHGGVGGC